MTDKSNSHAAAFVAFAMLERASVELAHHYRHDVEVATGSLIYGMKVMQHGVGCAFSRALERSGII